MIEDDGTFMLEFDFVPQFDCTFTLELDVTQLNAERAFRAQSARWFLLKRWPLNDMWFLKCVECCIANDEFLEQFDRLMKTNLCFKGTELELQIDAATGRTERAFELLLDFVRDYVFARVPRPSRFVQHTR